MGKGIPRGYAGMGTPGTDKGKDFCTHHHTRTHTRCTHTHHGGYAYLCWVKIYIFKYYIIIIIIIP
jgi:hypothetical protein